MSAVARRYYLRGCEALERSDLDTATDSLRAALELAPWFSSARVAYAVALARLGDCPRAAQALRAGLGRPASPVATASMWATLGDVLTRAGDFVAAEDAFQQAATHPAFQARAASGLTRVYGKLGRYADAVSQLKKASAQLAAEDDAPAPAPGLHR